MTLRAHPPPPQPRTLATAARTASSSPSSGLEGKACPDSCYFQSPHTASSLRFSSVSQLCLRGQTSNSSNEKRREGETEKKKRGERGKPRPCLLSNSLPSNVTPGGNAARPQPRIPPTRVFFHGCLFSSLSLPHSVPFLKGIGSIQGSPRGR